VLKKKARCESNKRKWHIKTCPFPVKLDTNHNSQRHNRGGFSYHLSFTTIVRAHISNNRAELIDGIGAISGVLGITGFFQDNIPDIESPDGATVRVKVGLSKDDEEAQLVSP
jgi:hypothetical protein